MTRSSPSLSPNPSPVSVSVLMECLASAQPKVREVLEPILLAQASAGISAESESRAVFVGSRKHKGLGGFDSIIYPPCSNDFVSSYCENLGVHLPQTCLEYLGQFNGGKFFELHLYGLDERVARPNHSHNQNVWRPRDLFSERLIRKRLSSLSHGNDGHFTFASRPSAPEEVLSYAIEYPMFTKIVAISRSGEVVASWETFTEFLASELQAAAKFDLEWCAGMAEIIASTSMGKRNAG